MAIDKVTCVGGGLIGHGWVTFLAWKGVEVTLHRRFADTLAPTLERIRGNLAFLARSGLLAPEEVEPAMGRIRATSDLEAAVSECDYVQESVLEHVSLKAEVFTRLDQLTPPTAILASSTSTLAMTHIAAGTRYPERCLVAHPWNPPYLVPLVELVPGTRTSPDTVAATCAFMERIGKVAVVQKKESVGAIGNRITAAIWREAIHIVLEGIADPEEVDKDVVAGPGLRLAALGPFLTYHLGGGEGGLAAYMAHIGPTMAERWKTLGGFVALSEAQERDVVRQVEQMTSVRTQTMAELVRERDQVLAALLKARGFGGP